MRRCKKRVLLLCHFVTAGILLSDLSVIFFLDVFVSVFFLYFFSSLSQSLVFLFAFLLTFLFSFLFLYLRISLFVFHFVLFSVFLRVFLFLHLQLRTHGSNILPRFTSIRIICTNIHNALPLGEQMPPAKTRSHCQLITHSRKSVFCFII